MHSEDQPRLQVANHCLSLSGITCRACDDACAVRAIQFQPRLGVADRLSINAAACTGCGDCLPVCPVDALSLNGTPDHG
ncbi:MAG: 4Fe-4S dicluster domain-containing protein [Geminicoccaceae bacterium]